MAITAETRKDIIELVVTALNEAPGTTLLNELVAIVNGGGTLADVAANIAASTAFTSKYPAFQTAEEFAAEWLSNLIPEASAAALAEATTAVVGLVNAGTSAADMLIQAQTFLSAAAETDASFGTSAANFNNKVEVATHHTVTLEQAASSSTAISSVTSDDATVEAGKTALGGGASAGGATFTATTGTDAVVGTAGNDVINAAAGTLNAGDTINGGDGTDTLNVTWTGTGPAQSASTLSNVEILNLTASPNPASLALTGVTGITEINNVSSANGATVTVSGVGAPVNSTLTGGQAATTISYTTAVTASTATSDKSTLTLAGTNLGASYTATGIEELTINSTKSANTLSSVGVSGATKVTVTGDQALTLNGTVGGSALTSVDASAFTGKTLSMTAGAGVGKTAKAGVAITLPTADTVTSTITAGGNKDTITLGAGNATVTAGSGDDTITSGAGTNTIMGGGGNDTIKLSGTKDTLRYAETGTANADTIEGFSSSSVIAVNLGTAKTATANASADSDFGVVQSGATSPTIGNVDGKGTGTAIVFQTVSPTATTTSNPVAAGSNVLALNGAFTDGTAAGVVTALGTSATTAITTAAASKFLLVTYSVGNIAQVWAYNGDDDSDGNIDASELALVATLSGVTQNSITASNFATYLTASTTAGTVSNSGQTINLTTPKNLVQDTPNSDGNFLTSANDTITVGTGALPTGAATATMGLTIIDPEGSNDADTLSAQVLNTDWDKGTLISNIETVNLEFLTAETNGFAWSSILPGTDTLNISGLTNVSDVHGVISGSTIGFGSSYKGTVELDGGDAAISALTLALNGSNGSKVADAPTLVADSGGGGDKVTTLTIKPSAASSLNLDVDSDDDFGTIKVEGSGNLTIFAGNVAEVDDANIDASDALKYTGTFTLVPSVIGTWDFNETGDMVKGLDVIDISAGGAAASVTLAAQTAAAEAFTVKHSPTATAETGGTLTVIANSGKSTDKLTVSLGSKSTGTGDGNAITATNFENLTVASSAASTVTTNLGDLLVAATVNTETVTVTGAGTFDIDNVNADTVSTAGVGKGVTIQSLSNTQGTTTFTGGAGDTTIVATGAATIANITTGKGADTITSNSAADVIKVGAGKDTVTGGDGIDSIDLGSDSDADTFIITNDAANHYDVVTNFNPGQDKVTFDESEIAIIGFANTAAVADLNSADYQEAAAGTVLADNKVNVITTAAGYADYDAAFAAAGAGGGEEAIVVFYNSTSGKVEIYFDVDNNDNANEVLLAQLDLTGSQLTSLSEANFAVI